MNSTAIIEQKKNSFLSNPMIEALKEREKELTELAEASRGIKVNGIDDKDWFQRVHDKEQILVKARTSLDTDRKVITVVLDDAKKFVMDIQKDLLMIIVPVEEELKAEKARINKLKAEAQEEIARKSKEKLNLRVWDLWEVGFTHPDLFTLETMKDAEFNTLLTTKKEAHKLKLEADKIEAEARAKYNAERATFEAEKAKLEAEKNAIAREKELKETAERATKETEARMIRERKDREANQKRNEIIAKAKADEEKAKLEADSKFKKWLSDNWVTTENKMEFEVRNENGVRVLYKRVSTYQA